MDYPFTEEEFEVACREWGCNCGPSALAFALQISLDEARRAIPDFDTRRYTSPTMMKEALKSLGVLWTDTKINQGVFHRSPSLVRVQWTGPWTAEGANPKWAYRHTHWIATWCDAAFNTLVFDCNGGIAEYVNWCEKIVPIIAGTVKRADGGWFFTHAWRVEGRFE